eukprot:scaffold822_cov250-Pinguiococcus_pyrenoidosus.AAC.7
MMLAVVFPRILHHQLQVILELFEVGVLAPLSLVSHPREVHGLRDEVKVVWNSHGAHRGPVDNHAKRIAELVRVHVPQRVDDRTQLAAQLPIAKRHN